MADEPQSNALALLFGLTTQGALAPSIPVIDRRVYKNNSLNLDGYTFHNCVFIGCVLYTTTGDFRIKDCHLQNCVIYYSGNSLRVVKLSSVLMNNWDHMVPGLRASVEPDGGVTIE